ncbi:MAG TPA: hypothetical protein ENN07_07855 [candidate division Zixibacteria bacterium]|nr:hypothetical protein [candidate division Zixibacteria bacterium]
MNVKISVCLIIALLFIALTSFANPLRISNIELDRVGVRLPEVTEKDIINNPGRYLLDSDEPFTGGLGWEVFCRLDTGGVDIVFIIDSTGSMGSHIAGVRANIDGLISALEDENFDYRLGAVTYGDGHNMWDFDPGTPGYQMTSDGDLFMSAGYLGGVGASGGADGPEQALMAFANAINDYQWRPDAMHVIIFFTDAAYCQRDDACMSACNPGAGTGCAWCTYNGPEIWLDTEIADMIAASGVVVFTATRDPVYTSTCASFTPPVPWTPYGGTGHTGWFQHFAHLSGGNWYNMTTTTWDVIFDDVTSLIREFVSVRATVFNDSPEAIDTIYAELIPGACISILSANPMSYGPIGPGGSRNFYWRIDYDSTCSGPDLCFNVEFTGGDYFTSAIGCLYIENCACPGPLAELVCPPNVSISACDYQDITINIIDEGNGIDMSEIALEVDGTVYHFPTNMTWDGSQLRFMPSERWEHDRVIVWNLMNVKDTIGCYLREDFWGAFLADNQPPSITNADPPVGFEFYDTIQFSWNLYDYPGGIDISSIVLTIAGNDYTPGDGHLQYRYSALPTAPDTLKFVANTFDIGLMAGQAFDVCLYVADGILPSMDGCDLCGPNDTTICYEYSISPCIGPEASIICPPPSSPAGQTISACPYQGINMELISGEYPLLLPTVELEVADVDFTLADDELEYIGNELIFTPQSPWTHGQVVLYNLHRADDTRGCLLTEDEGSSVTIDLEPPRVHDVQPQPGFEFTSIMEIAMWIEDVPAGINYENIVMTVDGVEYTIGDGFLSYEGSREAGIATISGLPSDFGIARGDTFDVCISVEDMVLPNDGICELCGPNSTTYCFSYMFYPETSCERFPNPFTPDGDGINDYAQFVYPEMYRLDGTIYIYNTRNVKVREIHVNYGPGAFEMARWDGTDRFGKLMPMGLYMYVIMTENIVVCEGTVTLVR